LPETEADTPATLAVPRRKRGRLKVFLGMSPGVGKTYEMLRAARRRKAEGLDVVVGVVETHGRKETMSLLRGLDVMPRAPIDHRGRSLMEFDLDGALARRPGLLLVDEYAHSNAPGSRHPKRWQDVEELRDAGIDIWTTLNIQHLESLSDVILGITGVRQRETVPDSVLTEADDIEVVDITPEDLRARLAEGKVYVPETARVASENFFKLENLTALRELALRRAAQTVDDQLLSHLRDRGVSGPWAAGERILVLVGGDAMSASLVRTGRRMSDMMMDAPWSVAHVERPSGSRSDARSIARLSEAFKLAEQLGARPVTLSGDDVVRAVLDHAHRNNVTQIVIGKTRGGRFAEWTGRALATELLRKAQGVAVHVVTEGDLAAPEPATRAGPRSAVDWRAYGVSAGFIGAATGIALLLDTRFERVDLGVIYLAAVVAAAVLNGLRPALAAATLAFLTYNFLFLQPRYSFLIGSPTDFLTLVLFWAVALGAGALAGRVREQARAAQRRAAAVSALLAASQTLSAAQGRAGTARSLAEQASAAAGAGAVVLLPDDDDIVLTAASPEGVTLGADAMAAARWAWMHRGPRHGHPAAEPLAVPTLAGRARPGRGGGDRRLGRGGGIGRGAAGAGPARSGGRGAGARRLGGSGAGDRDPAPGRPFPRRPDELGQPRPAYAVIDRAGLRDDADRLWGQPQAGGARRPVAEYPRRGRASVALCRRPVGHDPAGGRRPERSHRLDRRARHPERGGRTGVSPAGRAAHHARLSRTAQHGRGRSGPVGTGRGQHPGKRHRLQPRRHDHRIGGL
jgi:two-component system sensor histidine kinase KdpD